MHRRVLIANRGEIAVRIMRTARTLGMECVAVHTEIDRGAMHVREADRAILLEGGDRGYLDVDQVAAAARSADCDVVHPGYGFLSESPALARRLEAEGIAFAGPSADVLERLGDKAAARRCMQDAGLPVAPGAEEPKDNPWDSRQWAKAAGDLGYPVMVKAVAGGGGRGIRRVSREEDLEDAVAACRREATAAFGDGRLLVERCVEPARHVEVQVARGADGMAFHIYERECSLQRRHQKLLEEAPAPGLAGETVEAMRQAAVQAAEAAGYRGLGTVEFLVEEDGRRYCFMEINPRLQVEHPVTECVSGVDLVAMQFRIAAGESVEPPPPAPRGHAIEARLCAEDPSEGFRPSPGRIHSLRLPSLPGVRVDCGVEAGDSIPGAYDSLVAKVIAHGDSRPAALALLRQGLAAVEVAGIDTNRGFLHRLLDAAPVREGRYDTGTLEGIAQSIADSIDRPPREAVAAAALHVHLSAAPPLRAPFDSVDGWRIQGPTPVRVRLADASGEIETLLVACKDGRWRTSLDSEDSDGPPAIHVAQLAEGQMMVETQGAAGTYVVQEGGPGALEVTGAEGIWRVRQPAAGESSVEDTVAGGARSPLPGRVLRYHVAAGQRVNRGDPLVTVEAMKTEHTLRAPANGVVTALAREVDALVEEGEELVELKPEDPT